MRMQPERKHRYYIITVMFLSITFIKKRLYRVLEQISSQKIRSVPLFRPGIRYVDYISPCSASISMRIIRPASFMLNSPLRAIISTP